MFRRSTTRYGTTPEPVTPYQKAAQVWDERIGSARVQARNWRLMAFGSLLLSAGLGVGLVWQSARGTITPWVVQVDRLGQAQVVAPAIAAICPPIRRSLGIWRSSFMTCALCRRTLWWCGRTGYAPMISPPRRALRRLTIMPASMIRSRASGMSRSRWTSPR